MHDYNKENNLEEMKKRLKSIKKYINNVTNSDSIIIDFKVYSEILTLLEEIDEQWIIYMNNSDDLCNIFHALFDIHDIIENTKNHYEK